MRFKRLLSGIIAMIIIASVAVAQTDDLIKATAKKSAKEIEDAIENQAKIFKQKKATAHEKIERDTELSAQYLTTPYDRETFVSKHSAEIKQSQAVVDGSLDKELQDNVKTTLDHNEYSFRKRYIDASEQDKQNVIILYDAILDQLTEDGYMTKEDAAKRKAEWKT